MLALPALLVAAGCSDGAGPVRLVAGDWGGTDVALTAGPQRVTVFFSCSSARFTGAIAPDAAGDFTLRGGTTVQVAGPGPEVSVRGHVDGDQMTLVITFPTATGSVEQTYALQRGAPGVMTVCALA